MNPRSFNGWRPGSLLALLALSWTKVQAADATADGNNAPALPSVTISSSRLKEARIALSPKVGVTVHSVDQEQIWNMGQGDAAPLDDVLLRLPGVAKDTKASGAIHVRNEHGNVQYRVNGILLPEGIAGFGQTMDLRMVDRIDFLTGALPAQYGLRSAGVVDIQTKEGESGSDGGRVGMMLGGQETVQPSAELFGTRGRMSYYLSGSAASNALGIENPTPATRALHDRTRQARAFGNFSYLVDDDTRVGLLFGSYDGRFQIPNNPGQPAAFALAGISNPAAGISLIPSSRLDQRQSEQNRYAIVSLQKKVGPLDYQLSVFAHGSRLNYMPDPLGADLAYDGVATQARRASTAAGLQWDASLRRNAQHTWRAGLSYTRQKTRSDNLVQVFPADGSGAQTSDLPLTVADNSERLGGLASFYLQDEWRLMPRLTVNYGLRYDRSSAAVTESQWSPRVNVAWRATDATAVHAGYARYFTPAPQELAVQRRADLFSGTTNAAEVTVSNEVRAERSHYLDLGVTHQASREWTLGLSVYAKRSTNVLDEGQFGRALILSPFNYAQGTARGLELSANYAGASGWSGYANLAWQRAQARNIVSSQTLFGADELAYIATHDVRLDHDQTLTASGGLSYRWGTSRVSADLLYGSGMRRTGADGIPNGAALPGYTVVNLALMRSWPLAGDGALEARVAVLNLLDKTYLLRDGSGIGVGAPQYGLRRTLYVSASRVF